MFLGVCDKGSCAITIDIRQSEDSIRKDLLNYIPPGSHADDVIQFVLSRLHHDGLWISGVGIMPRPSIEVQLGHSFGVITHEVITAEWAFDERLNLTGLKISGTPGRECELMCVKATTRSESNS